MTDTNIKVNDQKVPLNEMMEVLLKNIILGYLKSAKGIPEEIKTIKIDINL